MFKLKTGHQPGVYVPLRALFLVNLKKCTVLELVSDSFWNKIFQVSFKS